MSTPQMESQHMHGLWWWSSRLLSRPCVRCSLLLRLELCSGCGGCVGCGGCGGCVVVLVVVAVAVVVALVVAVVAVET